MVRELDNLLSGSRLNEAEKAVVKLKNSDQNLGVLEAVSFFDWRKNSGNYYFLVSHLGAKSDPSVSLRFIQKLDFSFLPLNEARKVYDVYKLSGKLGLGKQKEFHENGKNIFFKCESPHAPMQFYVGGAERRFERILSSYYAFERTGQAIFGFNQKILLARISDNESILYRATFNHEELSGEKLWLIKNGDKVQLSSKENKKLISYMSELMKWHELRLYEEDCSVYVKRAKRLPPQSGYEGYA